MRSGTATTQEALALAVGTGTPVLLWGSPGAGKSSAITALARQMGMPCEVVVASIREPTDFAGLPVIENGSVRFAPPRWAHALVEAGCGVLFLDEVSTAPPAVQAALLRVILDRWVGDLRLPDEVRIIAAANPPEQSADGWDLAQPLANRFVHLDWVPDAAGVAAGLLGGFNAPRVAVLASDWWTAHGPAARALVAAFLTARPHMVTLLPSRDESEIRGFATPRSWETAARLWAACDAVHASDEARQALIVGTVGQGTGRELIAFARAQDLPDPESVLADPNGVSLPARGDQLLAVLTSVVAAVLAEPSVDRWQLAWRVLARAGQLTPDVAAVAARALAANRPSGARMPTEVKAFAALLQKAGRLSA